MTTHFKGPVNSTNGFVGAVTGNVTGNLTGDVTGNVTGNLTGTASAVSGTVTSTGRAVRSSAAITAGTTQTQAGATAIITDIVHVTTGNADDGVLLPAMKAGNVILIRNLSANAGKIYANGTETLNGTAGNAGSTALGASKLVTVTCVANGVSISSTN